MPIDSQIILSIIVIAHNQRDELRRCVDSILAQPLPFAHEIIISEDRSTDGTWELMQEYKTAYPDTIVITQCNSDACNPANNSQRSGWNRCNAYPLARGKYIAHVDADDYFRSGSNVYKRQVEMLEQHPECSLCMQNVWILEEEAAVETGTPWFDMSRVQNGRVINAHDFICNDYFILNQAFVMRRNSVVDPVALYGKRYVDSVITYHHLQFGDVVCVDSCDYMYMKHAGAVTTSMIETDRAVCWNLGIYIPMLIPSLTGLFFVANLPSFLNIVNRAKNGEKLSETSDRALKELRVFIYDVFSKDKICWFEKFRLSLLRYYLLLLVNLHLHNACCLRILYRLMIRFKIDSDVNFKIR